MAGFKFRYAKVLQVRMDEEDEQKQKLANKIADMLRIREKIENLNRDRESYSKKLMGELKGGTSAVNLWAHNSAKRWYKNEIDEYSHMLELAETEVSKARADLMTASQEVKKLEKLKENALNEFRAEEEKQLSEMIDGVISFQSAMKPN